MIWSFFAEVLASLFHLSGSLDGLFVCFQSATESRHFEGLPEGQEESSVGCFHAVVVNFILDLSVCYTGSLGIWARCSWCFCSFVVKRDPEAAEKREAYVPPPEHVEADPAVDSTDELDHKHPPKGQ